MVVKILALLLPWKLKRWVLQKYFRFEIHPTARIGFSWIYPKKLVMGAGASINHFTIGINLEKIVMGKKSSIGRNNWITGFPKKSTAAHFSHQPDRKPELRLGEESAITKNHHFDCTNLIEIGRFTTIAGYNSQFLTHSIDVIENRQDSASIIIGEYCFVGTNVTVLSGSSIPAKSVLGAKSLLNTQYFESWTLYGGVPAKPIKKIAETAKYFNRDNGFVI